MRLCTDIPQRFLFDGEYYFCGIESSVIDPIYRSRISHEYNDLFQNLMIQRQLKILEQHVVYTDIYRV